MSESQREQRIKKIDALRERGVDPFGGRFPRRDTASSCHSAYQEGKEAVTAGRIVGWREHGKSIFADLQDSTGKIQLYLRRDTLGEEGGALLALLDLGDIVGAEGTLFTTKMGEVSVLVKRLTLLSKALRPLPEKWHGLKDTEVRFRQRYLDLVVTPETREVFQIRFQAIRALRRTLDDRGFLEVETPMMQAAVGGAAARPFVTHHHALDIDLYLRIAPELYLKRLLVGGWERIYELNRNFRNEGISTRHNPEFTMLEVYQAYADWRVMMELTRDLVLAAAEATEQVRLDRGEIGIDLSAPWAERTYFGALEEGTGIDFRRLSAAEVKEKAARCGVTVTPEMSREQAVDGVFDKAVQPALQIPTFIVDYPIELTPLARTKADDPGLAARFELFIGGMELANGYTELNDPLEQRERFAGQLKKGTSRGEVDEDFVLALEHGMPPAGGMGMGIDRLAMLLAGATSIREVILFPHLRPKTEEQDK